jgi:hypothetical protein
MMYENLLIRMIALLLPRNIVLLLTRKSNFITELRLPFELTIGFEGWPEL